MPKKVIRDGDITVPHPGCGPTINDTTADKVLVNGKKAIKKGNQTIVHCGVIGKYDQDRIIYIEGKPIQAQSDPITCGCTSGATFSNDVYVE